MRKKKDIISTVVLVLLILVGLSVMLYPIVSDWVNSKTQSRLVENYDQQVSKMDESQYEEFFNKANEYNKKLNDIHSPLTNYDEIDGYESVLDITGTGIMGYVTIPQIDVELPIYHGTTVEILSLAAGHLQGSSLPVGGQSTHAVISAHRGLPTSKLFSDLDMLCEGDVFTVTVLNQTLTYKVDKISIVKPYELENLAVENGKDYVTLMTCTPYGINTHRLLVRGVRIETEEAEKLLRITADATKVDNMLVVPFFAVPLLIVLIIIWTVGGRKKAKLPLEIEYEFYDK